MNKLTVKRWIADQKRDEMKKYNLAPCFEYVTNEDGVEYYADEKNDTVTFIIEKKAKETEKAICVEVQTETRTGMNAHKAFTLWFPKSQIVNEA